jgi:hypothetical protein
LAQVVSSGLWGFRVQGEKKELHNLRINGGLRGVFFYFRARDTLENFYSIFKE